MRPLCGHVRPLSSLAGLSFSEKNPEFFFSGTPNSAGTWGTCPMGPIVDAALIYIHTYDAVRFQSFKLNLLIIFLIFFSKNAHRPRSIQTSWVQSLCYSIKSLALHPFSILYMQINIQIYYRENTYICSVLAPDQKIGKIHCRLK